MLRQYAQFNPQRANLLGIDRQGHHTRIVSGEALDWCIDFEKALNQLPEMHRILLLLVHGAGFEQAEAARLTGVKPRTLAFRLADAEMRLRDSLEAQQAAQESGDNHRRPCRQNYGRNPIRTIHAIPESE